MKKLSTLIIVGAGLLIASCSTEHSIVKRHYTKGYYVDHIASVDKAQPAAKAIAAPVSKPVTEQIIRSESQEQAQAVRQESRKASTSASASTSAKKHTSSPEPQPEEKKMVSDAPVVVQGIAPSASRKEVKLDARERSKNRGGDDANVALLVLLCIFIPFLAVYLKEKSITVNFWIDLLLCFLFYIPGIIFAFYICFAK
jgi:uncharacterized membrane protein YqaE (UPF0057 family)